MQDHNYGRRTAIMLIQTGERVAHVESDRPFKKLVPCACTMSKTWLRIHWGNYHHRGVCVARYANQRGWSMVRCHAKARALATFNNVISHLFIILARCICGRVCLPTLKPMQRNIVRPHSMPYLIRHVHDRDDSKLDAKESKPTEDLLESMGRGR